MSEVAYAVVWDLVGVSYLSLWYWELPLVLCFLALPSACSASVHRSPVSGGLVCFAAPLFRIAFVLQRQVPTVSKGRDSGIPQQSCSSTSEVSFQFSFVREAYLGGSMLQDQEGSWPGAAFHFVHTRDEVQCSATTRSAKGFPCTTWRSRFKSAFGDGEPFPPSSLHGVLLHIPARDVSQSFLVWGLSVVTFCQVVNGPRRTSWPRSWKSAAEWKFVSVRLYEPRHSRSKHFLVRSILRCDSVCACAFRACAQGHSGDG